MIYRDKVAALSLDRKFANGRESGARGVEVELSCGTFVEFIVSTEEGGRLTVNYRSNGCGYMVAAAEALSRQLDGSNIISLGGLNTDKLSALCLDQLAIGVTERTACVAASVSSLLAAFRSLRQQRISQTALGNSLICSCFGVTESEIAATVEDNDLHTVDEVANAINAGSGCGACRLLIQEVIDHRQ